MEWVRIALEYIVPFVVVFGCIVLIHELGHFAAARYFGIRVEKFSIGFGPELLAYRDKRHTIWRLGLIPLGGYVAMNQGEAVSEKPATFDGTFVSAPLWWRVIIILAGSFANFALGIVLLTVVYVSAGKQLPANYLEYGIGGVQENSPAHQAGLKQGDIILSINGEDVTNFEDIKNMVTASQGQAMKMQIQSTDNENNKEYSTAITAIDVNGKGSYKIGVYPTYSLQRLSIFEAFSEAFLDCFRLIGSIFSFLGNLTIGQGDTSALGGPIKIVQLSKDFAQLGIVPFLLFIAALSINIGFVNLLPIPILDGGHLVFYIFEAFLGKPLNLKQQNLASKVGLVMIICLLVFATYQDILSFWAR